MRQTRRDFLKHASTVATVLAVPALTGCTEEDEGPEINMAWEDRATELETVTWTAGNPGDFPPEVHIPEATYNSGARSVTVLVPHVMTAEHYISTIYIRDQDGVVLGLQEYAVPTADGEQPSIDFPLHESTTTVVAYAYCNLHDNWAAGDLAT